MRDLQLEERLRTALRAEADALPLTITAENLRDRLAERRRERTGRLGVLSAAAAIVIVVGVGAVLLADRGTTPPVGTSPSPSPSSGFPADLETLEQMRAAIGIGLPLLLIGEHAGDPAHGDDNLETYEVGIVEGDGFYEVAYDCSGADPFTVSWFEVNGASPRLLTSAEIDNCDGGTSLVTAADMPASARLSITTSPRTSWRVLVFEPVPDNSTPVPTGSATAGLPAPPEIPTEPNFVRVAAEEIGENDPGTTTLLVTLPEGTDAYFVGLTCVGEGAVLAETPTLPLRSECHPGEKIWSRWDLVPPAAASFEIAVRTTGTTRARVVVDAYDVDTSPNVKFVPPLATLSAATSVNSAHGCLSFALASGKSGADQCGPSNPVMPLDRTLTVHSGEEVTFVLGPGWTINGLIGESVLTSEILDLNAEVAYGPLVDLDGGTASVTFSAPVEPGDWTLRLTTSGTRGGDRFDVPYFFRVIVEP